MKLVTIFTLLIFARVSSCDNSGSTSETDQNCIEQRLNTLQQKTRKQDAGSLILYKNKETEDLYYVYYYAEDKGMLDKGGVTVIDEDCNEICQGSIMTHWAFCVENLNMEDVEKVEEIWKQN